MVYLNEGQMLVYKRVCCTIQSPIVIYPWIFLFILLATGEGTENDIISGLHEALGLCALYAISCMIC